MKHWVITATIDPSKLEGVVSSRCGRFVAYDKFLQRWIMVWGGGEKEIAEPSMIFVEEEWARANRDLSRKVERRENPFRVTKQKAEQLLLL